MFNVNNTNNGTVSQNAWNQIKLFNQLTLCYILNGRNDLGTPELRAAVASMSEEQKDDVLVFLECNTEELAGLPNGCGIQAVVNCKSLLDYLPTHGNSQENSWLNQKLNICELQENLLILISS